MKGNPNLGNTLSLETGVPRVTVTHISNAEQTRSPPSAPTEHKHGWEILLRRGGSCPVLRVTGSKVCPWVLITRSQGQGRGRLVAASHRSQACVVGWARAVLSQVH